MLHMLRPCAKMQCKRYSILTSYAYVIVHVHNIVLLRKCSYKPYLVSRSQTPPAYTHTCPISMSSEKLSPLHVSILVAIATSGIDSVAITRYLRVEAKQFLLAAVTSPTEHTGAQNRWFLYHQRSAAVSLTRSHVVFRAHHYTWSHVRHVTGRRCLYSIVPCLAFHAPGSYNKMTKLQQNYSRH